MSGQNDIFEIISLRRILKTAGILSYNVILTVLHDSSESEENSKNDLPEDQEESELR
jgi:hypothetical protein